MQQEKLKELLTFAELSKQYISFTYRNVPRKLKKIKNIYYVYDSSLIEVNRHYSFEAFWSAVEWYGYDNFTI